LLEFAPSETATPVPRRLRRRECIARRRLFFFEFHRNERATVLGNAKRWLQDVPETTRKGSITLRVPPSSSRRCLENRALERAHGLGVLVQLTRCAPAARDGSRHARVVILGGARAGRQPRLGAPEGGASESPRWSGRAVGSRRTVWRLSGRWDRPFSESPSVDHPPNGSPSDTDSLKTAPLPP